MSRRLLFISHQADRTGAPIVLLHLLRWLKQNADIEILILLERGGELEDEFKLISDTYIWNLPVSIDIWQNRLDRITRKQFSHEQQVIKKIKHFKPDAIYGNTIVTAPIGTKLKQLINCPFICHVHELSVVIHEYFGKHEFTEYSRSIDFFIAASEAVAKNLIASHHIDHNLVSVVHEFVPDIDFKDYKSTRISLRMQLGIAEDSFVVAGAGSIDWRKGPDLFIQVAQRINLSENMLIDFIWIGGKLDSSDGRKVQHDLLHGGVSEQVRFLGAQINPYDYLSIADAFLLTSREDPYPLVCLEAASLAKPIICFADSGGMPEFVEDDCGIIVPYLRTDLMADALLALHKSKSLREELGQNAAQKMRQRHTIELSGRRIIAIIDTCVS